MANKYQAVHLDQLLCDTKGRTETGIMSSTSPGSYRPKIKSVESISGIDWYYFLVPNEKHISLTDYMGRNEINRMFIVCATLPNKNNEKKPIRLFTAFNSILDFIDYVRKIPKNNWFFFEVILGGQTQKLYFDIDIDVDKLADLGLISEINNQDRTQCEMDSFTNQLITNLVTRIVNTFSVHKYKIDIAKQILLFSSNSYTKRSYHIIVDGYAVLNYKENLVLASEVLDGFPPEYIKKGLVDPSMYSAKQQLRLYQSQKPGSGRPKVFVDEWYYGSNSIKYPYPKFHTPDQATAEALRFTLLFQSSCVTFTDACQVVPILFDTSIENSDIYVQHSKLWPDLVGTKLSHAQSGAFDDFEDYLVDMDLVKVICDRVDNIIFEIYKVDKVVGSLILLRRKTPAYCSLCERIHENENAFLRVNKAGKVFFYCRRNDNNHKIIADISDLMPSTKELERNQLHSIINQLQKQTPNPPRPLGISAAPTPFTLHSQLRTIASQGSLVFKSRELGIPTLDN
jgi:hypothetical protein